MPLIMGPPAFATIRDVKATPTATGFIVTGTTDQPIQLQLDYWSQNDPGIPSGIAGTAPVEAGPTTQHSFTVTLPAGNRAGYWYGYNFRQDSNDTSGLTWRGYQGIAQVPAKFNRATPAVPVRFYNFGGTPPPPAGGGAIAPAPSNQGNWSTYAWAQWNPKGTAFPN